MRYNSERFIGLGAVVAAAAIGSAGEKADQPSPNLNSTTSLDNNPFEQVLDAQDPLLVNAFPEGFYIEPLVKENSKVQSPLDKTTTIDKKDEQSFLDNESVSYEPVVNKETKLIENEQEQIADVVDSSSQEDDVDSATPEVAQEAITPTYKVTIPGISADGEVKEHEERVIPFELLSQGLDLAVDKRSLYVINKEEELRELYMGLNNGHGEEAPDIDFDNKSVVALIGGSRFTDREMVEITEINDTGDEVEITVLETNPDFTKCHYEKNPTVSYHFVVTEKINEPLKEVVVEDNGCYDLTVTENGIEKTPAEEIVDVPVEFFAFAKDTHGGISKAQNMVIDSQEELENLTQQMYDGYGFPEEPEINFDEEYIVASFMGYNFVSKGVDIEIKEIIDKGDHYEAYVLETTPDFSENPDAYEKNPSAPYHMVKISGKYDENKPVEFIVVSRTVQPE